MEDFGGEGGSQVDGKEKLRGKRDNIEGPRGPVGEVSTKKEREGGDSSSKNTKKNASASASNRNNLQILFEVRRKDSKVPEKGGPKAGEKREEEK